MELPLPSLTSLRTWSSFRGIDPHCAQSIVGVLETALQVLQPLCGWFCLWNNAVSDIYVACSRSSEQLIKRRTKAFHWTLYETRSGSPRSTDSISSDEEEMRTMGSSGSESSTPDKMATAASIFTEQSNLVSKCKRFEQKYRMALEQKVACVCVLRESSFNFPSPRGNLLCKDKHNVFLPPWLHLVLPLVGYFICSELRWILMTVFFTAASTQMVEQSDLPLICVSGLPGGAGPPARGPAVRGCVSKQKSSAEPGRHTPHTHTGEGAAGVHHTGATGPTVSSNLCACVCAHALFWGIVTFKVHTGSVFISWFQIHKTKNNFNFTERLRYLFIFHSLSFMFNACAF